MAESSQSEYNLTVWPATQRRRQRAIDREAGHTLAACELGTLYSKHVSGGQSCG